jgi:hypothetical protein
MMDVTGAFTCDAYASDSEITEQNIDECFSAADSIKSGSTTGYEKKTAYAQDGSTLGDVYVKYKQDFIENGLTYDNLLALLDNNASTYSTTNTTDATTAETKISAIIKGEVINYIHAKLSGSTFYDTAVQKLSTSITDTYLNTTILSKLPTGSTTMDDAFHTFVKGKLTIGSCVNKDDYTIYDGNAYSLTLNEEDVDIYKKSSAEEYYIVGGTCSDTTRECTAEEVTAGTGSCTETIEGTIACTAEEVTAGTGGCSNEVANRSCVKADVTAGTTGCTSTISTRKCTLDEVDTVTGCEDVNTDLPVPQFKLYRFDGDDGYYGKRESECLAKVTKDACGVVSDTNLTSIVSTIYSNKVDSTVKTLYKQYAAMGRFLKAGESGSGDSITNTRVDYLEQFLNVELSSYLGENLKVGTHVGMGTGVSIQKTSDSTPDYVLVMSMPKILAPEAHGGAYADLRVVIGDGTYDGVSITLLDYTYLQIYNNQTYTVTTVKAEDGTESASPAIFGPSEVTDSRKITNSLKTILTSQGDNVIKKTAIFDKSGFKTRFTTASTNYKSPDSNMVYSIVLTETIVDKLLEFLELFYRRYYLSFFSSTEVRSSIASLTTGICNRVFFYYFRGGGCYTDYIKNINTNLNPGFYMGLYCEPDGWHIIDRPMCKQRCGGQKEEWLDPDGYSSFCAKPKVENLRHKEVVDIDMLAHRGGGAACMVGATGLKVLVRGTFKFSCDNGRMTMTSRNKEKESVTEHNHCDTKPDWKRVCSALINVFGQTSQRERQQYGCSWYLFWGELYYEADVEGEKSFSWEQETRGEIGFMCPNDEKVYKYEDDDGNKTKACDNRWKKTAKITYDIYAD